MTITPLEPDVPLLGDDTASPADDSGSFGRMLSQAFTMASGTLKRADAAEHAFVHGKGGLQEMMVERARADIALSLAAATASRTAQAVSTVLGMQV